MKIYLIGILILATLSLKAQTETITDVDSNTYSTVRNGSQIWMVENLKTTKFNDGSSIPLVINDSVWGTMSQPAYCWYKNDDKSGKKLFGALYNWYAVETGKLCPVGWHAPSHKVWLSNEQLPGGYRDEKGSYWYLNNVGFYWTITELSATEAYIIAVSWTGHQVTRDYSLKSYGFSVRCIKNN
jgi:hypothetical protein